MGVFGGNRVGESYKEYKQKDFESEGGWTRVPLDGLFSSPVLCAQTQTHRRTHARTHARTHNYMDKRNVYVAQNSLKILY